MSGPRGFAAGPGNRRSGCSRHGFGGCRPALPAAGYLTLTNTGDKALDPGRGLEPVLRGCFDPPQRHARNHRGNDAGQGAHARAASDPGIPVDRLSPHAHACRGVGRHQQQDPDHSEILRRLGPDCAVRGPQESWAAPLSLRRSGLIVPLAQWNRGGRGPGAPPGSSGT